MLRKDNMPFKSKAQMKMMYAKHPEIAKKWMKKYGMPKDMPEKAKMKKKIKKAMKRVKH